MTENQQKQIIECRENGMTISEAADATVLPLETERVKRSPQKKIFEKTLDKQYKLVLQFYQ